MAKPVVDGIEKELEGIRLVRVNALSREGGVVAGHYGIQGVPTLLVIDGNGELVLRQTGRLQKDAVRRALGQLASHTSP